MAVATPRVSGGILRRKESELDSGEKAFLFEVLNRKKKRGRQTTHLLCIELLGRRGCQMGNLRGKYRAGQHFV